MAIDRNLQIGIDIRYLDRPAVMAKKRHFRHRKLRSRIEGRDGETQPAALAYSKDADPIGVDLGSAHREVEGPDTVDVRATVVIGLGRQNPLRHPTSYVSARVIAGIAAVA